MRAIQAPDSHIDQHSFPRVVAFGGSAGLRRTLGPLSVALRRLGAPDAREWLSAAVSSSWLQRDAIAESRPLPAGIGDVMPATVDQTEIAFDADSGRRRLRIDSRARPNPDLLRRIINADVIVVGPGRLYRDILPALLVGGVAPTISGIGAVRIYVANLMTEPGETDGFTVAECLEVIRDHTRAELFDYVLVHRVAPDRAAPVLVRPGGARPMPLGSVADRELVVVEEDLAQADGPHAGHSPVRLARAILDLARLGPRRGALGAVADREPATRAPATDAITRAYARMITTEASFWLAVHEPFMRHDLTRDDVREVVRRGLERTGGNYRLLAELFNLTQTEGSRFIAFLHQYDCDVSFRHSA